MPDVSNFDPWHLVHAAWGGLAVVAGWVWRDHIKRDDDRFGTMTSTLNSMSDKISTNHQEILKLLLDQKGQLIDAASQAATNAATAAAAATAAKQLLQERRP